MKHNCDGELLSLKYEIYLNIDGFPFAVMVDGFQCDKCNEKVMNRDTLLFIESEVKKFRKLINKSKKNFEKDKL